MLAASTSNAAESLAESAASLSLMTQSPDAQSDLKSLRKLDSNWAVIADSLRNLKRPDSAKITTEPVSKSIAAFYTEPSATGTRDGRGSLSGQVVADNGGSPLGEVRITLVGQDRHVFTEKEGRFEIPDLNSGAVSLLIYNPRFEALTCDSLPIKAGKNAGFVFRLEERGIDAGRVNVVGRVAQASEAGLLFAQKNAPTVSDGISAEQMSRGPDGDAASALRRVTGISLGGDGLVYVRGLGERYVNVQLNGLSLSSPNPEKRVIPMDMFPTRLLENLVVAKTFTSDQPAEFAGGSLQIQTKDYPDKNIFEISMGGGLEPGTTFRKGLTYDGGSTDWLGTDDGTRAYPSNIPKENFDHRSSILGSTSAERQAKEKEFLSSLKNEWTPHSESIMPAQSYGLTAGQKIEIGEASIFGWLLGATYGLKSGQDDLFSAKIRADSTAEKGVTYQYGDRSIKNQSQKEILWGLLGTTTLDFGNHQTVRFNSLVSRQFEDKVGRVYGHRESDNDTSLLFELSTAQQTLSNYQMLGDHHFGDEDDGPHVKWMAALSGAQRYEPDYRVSKYFISKPGDSLADSTWPYFNAATLGLQDRYWFDLDESGKGGMLQGDIGTFALAEDPIRLSLGGSLFTKRREFKVDRISYFAGPRLASDPIDRNTRYEDFFGQFNGASDSGYITNKARNPKDNYQVDDVQWALYTGLDVPLPSDFRTILGARWTGALVSGTSVAPEGLLTGVEKKDAVCDTGVCSVPFGYNEVNVLPSAALIYALTEQQNLRLSYTQTFSFPEYREMAPTLFFSYEDALETVGNVNLGPTRIHNADLRWEDFLPTGEMFALSGFYKYFEDPVEILITQISSNYRSTFTNATSAWMVGAEAEGRFELERFTQLLSPFKVLTNWTFIFSRVDGDRRRALQGQSPYLINAILFYEPKRFPIQASLLYNRLGQRIAKVGNGGFPDLFDSPRQSLEFSAAWKLGKRFKLKATGKNLTGETVKQTQGGLNVRESKTNPAYSLGITYVF